MPRPEPSPSPVAVSAAAAAVAAAVFFLGLQLTPLALARFHYNDFGTFYRASQSGVLYGADPDLPVVGTSALANLNAPYFHLFFHPLTLLPLATAYGVWLAVTAVVIGWGLWRTARRIAPRWPWWMWLVILAWTPLFSLAYTGQVTALVFLPLVQSWQADREARPWVAGVWLGLAVALKPHLVLLPAWWVMRRRWQGLVAMAVTVAALVATGAGVYGWNAYASWIGHLRAASWPWMAMNSSLWALPSRLFHHTPYYASLGEAPGLVVLATAVLVVPALLATLASLRRETRHDVAWSLALTATAILIPLGWTYYAWWWVPMTLGLPLSRRTWVAVAACLSFPTLIVAGWADHSVLCTVTLASAPVYGSVILWAAVLRLSSSNPRGIEPPSPYEPTAGGSRRSETVGTAESCRSSTRRQQLVWRPPDSRR